MTYPSTRGRQVSTYYNDHIKGVHGEEHYERSVSKYLTLNISGTRLPNKLELAAVVEYDKTFNIIGGYSWSPPLGPSWVSNKILKYDPDGRQWIEVPTTLSENKAYQTAIKVKASFFKTC